MKAKSSTKRKQQHVVLNKQQQELVMKHMSYAQHIGIRYRGMGVSVDDLQQEACLGLCEAAARWDPKRDTDFRSYAYPWCVGCVTSAIRQGTSVKVDDMADVSLFGEDLTTEEEEEREKLVERVMQMTRKLNKKEREVIYRVYGFEGDPQGFKKISQDMHLTRLRVHQLYESAMNKIESATHK